jgi:hypothetical protein
VKRWRVLFRGNRGDYGGQMKPLPVGLGKQPTEVGMTRRGSQRTTFGKKMMMLMTRR